MPSNLVVVLPPLLVETPIVEGNPFALEARDEPFVSDHELHDPAADMGRDVVLPHEGVLILRRSHLENMDFTGEAIFGLVVVADEEDVGFLPTLVGLDDLLHLVGGGVGRTAPSVDDTHNGVLLLSLEDHVVFHVAEVMDVLSTKFTADVFEVLADVDALALDVPSFVVVTRNEVGVDSLALWPVLGEELALTLDSVCNKIEPVETALAVNHVSALVHVGDTFLGPDVEEGVEHVHPCVLGAKVVVGSDADFHHTSFET